VFATESAPGLAISGITSGYLLKLIVALGSVLLVFIVLALLTKKIHRYGQSQHRDLSVLSTMSVGTRERLMVVQVGEAQLLLGVTASRIDNLFVLETPLQGSHNPVSDSSGSVGSGSGEPGSKKGSLRQPLVPGNASSDFRRKLNQFLRKNGSSA